MASSPSVPSANMTGPKLINGPSHNAQEGQRKEAFPWMQFFMCDTEFFSCSSSVETLASSTLPPLATFGAEHRRRSSARLTPPPVRLLHRPSTAVGASRHCRIISGDDRSWMRLPRSSIEWQENLQNFLDITFGGTSRGGTVACPCPRCVCMAYRPRPLV